MNIKLFTCPSPSTTSAKEMIIIAFVFNVMLLSSGEGTFITHSHVTYIFLKNYFVDFNSEP